MARDMMAKSLPQLKKLLWKEFALFMKLKYSGDGATVCCFTCGAHLEIGTSNCQLGHWLPKGGYSVHYFNPNNCRPQCYHCNVSLSGNTAVFERRLKEEIGEMAVDEIYESRHQSGKRPKEWYIGQIEHYRNQLKCN
jgi:hypothetical protein